MTARAPTKGARSWDLGPDLGLLFAAKALIGAWVLSRGFSHVSDDDYARVVIAELFAHAPKLDPSGTSWLPFPFWLNGAAMIALGRSLATAKGVAFVIGVVAVAPPYLALRGMGVTRWTAMAGVVVAMATPWSAWLAVATVPEALTAGLVAAGAFALSGDRPCPWFGAGLLAAALSRYEAWPACAVCACGALWTMRARVAEGARDSGMRDADLRHVRRRALLTAALAAAGPLLWIAWNAHAHGDPLHFFARVAKYKQSLGAAEVPLADKLAAYPTALVRGAREIAALAAIGVFSLGDRAMRRRWRAPLCVAGAILAFLVYGELKDGAPTHHAERALLAVWWILAAFGVDGARALIVRVAWLRVKREAWAVAMTAAAVATWAIRVAGAYDEYPAREPDEQRSAQVARGLELRAQGSAAFAVTPCAFEHFALLAAFGAPERVTIEEATHARVTAACPAVGAR